MGYDLRTIDGIDVDGRWVLLRPDFNVPLTQSSDDGAIGVADDTRIRAALATIEELRRRGGRLVLVSHLDRPEGPDPALSMRPVADRLSNLTGVPVPLAPTVVGPEVRDLADQLEPGQMLLLENVRFEPGETRNDPALATALAELAEIYVDDAFATAHRAHASTVGVAELLASAAGRLMEREVHALSAVVDRPDRPLAVVLGGAKIGDKIGVVQRFLELADRVCVGGGMCFPFLAALGHSVGQSLCPPEDVGKARMTLDAIPGASDRLSLPNDLVLGRWGPDRAAQTRVLDGVDIPDGWMGLDIGPRTAARYAQEIMSAATVFWNGPMGRFELSQFAAGTRTIAEAVAGTSATTVAGGGETLQALHEFRLQDRVSHLSTGGAAMLEFLEGRELPGIQVVSNGPLIASSGKPEASNGGRADGGRPPGRPGVTQGSWRRS